MDSFDTLDNFAQVPAEIVFEKPHSANDFKWCWAVCQPDATWAEWCSGSSFYKEDALLEAQTALTQIHRQQQRDHLARMREAHLLFQEMKGLELGDRLSSLAHRHEKITKKIHRFIYGH